MYYALYRLSDGAILSHGFCGTLDQVTGMAEDGVTAACEISADVTGTTHYISDGEPIPYTPEMTAAFAQPPGANWIWNAQSGWVDNRTLEQAKAEAAARLYKQRDELEYANFTCDGVTYTADEIAQRRVAGAIQLALLAQSAGNPFSVEWQAADDSTITLDGPGIIAVGEALGASVIGAFDRWRAAMAMLNTATSNAQLDAINA